ncbi:uncharacterized protein [Diadema antillarum]
MDQPKKRKSGLQAAFERFRRGRQDEIRQEKLVRERELSMKQDPDRMWALRMKFLEQAKKYMGVPYAKRYHAPGSPMYDAPLFLDCCGLVRRCLLDLKEDFGFRVGSWNQAYHYDTLPITLTEDQMKPGDLVFISGTYFNEKSRKQKHDMVHVEIWLGDGPKTIGARWQKGQVQIFDSYAFVSKSYHSMVYHFKSIDTWLQGICRSYCDEHPWTRIKYKPGKKSIFSVDQKKKKKKRRKRRKKRGHKAEGGQEPEEDEVDEEEMEERADPSDEDEDGEEDEEEEAADIDTEGEEEERKDTSQEEHASEMMAMKSTGEKTLQDMEIENIEAGLKVLGCGMGRDGQTGILDVAGDSRMGLESEAIEGDANGTEMLRKYDFDQAEGRTRLCDDEIDDDVTSLDEEFPHELENEDLWTRANVDINGDNGEDEGYNDCCHGKDNLPPWKPQCVEGTTGSIYVSDRPQIKDPEDNADTILNLNFNSNNNNNNNNSNDHVLICCHDNGPNIAEGDDGKGEATSSSGAGAGGARREENGGGAEKDSSALKESKGTSGDRQKGGKNGGGGRGGKSPIDSSGRKSVMQVDTSPAFYIGGNNGVPLIEGPLLARGWRRITDKTSDNFKLKWVELKSGINYNTFKPGEQLVNRIPNSGILATKTGLFNTLREYERICDRTKGSRGCTLGLRMEEFFPESFILDLKPDREAFFETFKEGEIWICKPNGMNQGKGIYLVRDITQLRERYQARDVAASSSKEMQRRIRGYTAGQRLIQRYIPNPLLLNGKKFDVRSYMLIACTNPFIVLFHHGYLRLSCENYDPDSRDISTHLTNQYQQKKNPNYQDIKEETVWSMEDFNDHVNKNLAEEKGLAKDWVFGFFQKRMCQIMTQCFLASKNKLEPRLGYFDLLGFDFLLDTDMKIWLLEINVNPALHTNCEVLRNELPAMIEETLDVVLEIFEKRKRKQNIMPLSQQRRYRLLFNAESGGSVPSVRPPTRKALTSVTASGSRAALRSPRKSVSPQRAATKSKSPRQPAASSSSSSTSLAASSSSSKTTLRMTHVKQPPVVKLTLRKNVTPLSPPIVQLQQGGRAIVPQKPEEDLKEVETKISSVQL